MHTPIYSVRAVISDAGAGVYEKIWRILACGRAVFAWEADVAGLNRLHGLKPGTTAFMGVIPLVDGTFRLYWLHIPGMEPFEPHALPRHAQHGLNAVRHGDAAACVPLESLGPCPDPQAGAEREFLAELEQAPPRKVPATLYKAQGTAVRISAHAGLHLQPKARMDPYLSYAFTCAGRRLHFTFSNEKSLASPVHPFFIAEGDRVRVVVGEDQQTIQALYNLEDGCRYLRTVGAYASRRWVRQHLKNALGVSACIVGASLVGVMLDAMTGEVFLAVLAVAAFVGGVLWLGAVIENFLGRRYGGGRADLLRIFEALDLPGSGEEKIPYVHELQARYPVSLPGAVAGGGRDDVD